MTQTKPRYYRVRNGRTYWQPTKAMRAYGSQAAVLGVDGPDARAAAEVLNAKWDIIRGGDADADTLALALPLRRIITASPHPTERQPIAARLILTAIVVSCVAYLNVWPKMSKLLAGTADSAGWGPLVYQLLALSLLACAGFAIFDRDICISRVSKLCLAGLVILLIGVNLSYSIESIGIARDATSEHNRQAADDIARWLQELADARAGRKALPAFAPTTEGQSQPPSKRPTPRARPRTPNATNFLELSAERPLPPSLKKTPR